MRVVALLAAVFALAPQDAGAQALAPASQTGSPQTYAPSADPSLSDVVFVDRGPTPSLAGGFLSPAPGQGLSGQPAPAVSGAGLVGWSSSQVSRPAAGGAVDSVRMSVAGVTRAPLLMGPGVVYDPQAVNVSVSRGWPGAVRFGAGPVGVSVTPHAGVGFDSVGGSSAEAGARLEVSPGANVLRDKLEAMGVKDGAEAYGRQGRWYLFAAVRGQAVGLNMQETAGALRRTGWSTDVSSALIGDGQVGVGWRKGGIEASFGYVHRGVHIQNAPLGASDSYADDMAALAFTYHPHW